MPPQIENKEISQTQPKKKWGRIAIIAISVLILILAVLWTWNRFGFWHFTNRLSGNEPENTLIKIIRTAWGGTDELVLYNDKSFRHTNDYPMNPEAICMRGTVEDGNFESFLDYLRSSEISDSKITQRNQQGLECEGDRNLWVNIDGEENNLRLPCVEEYTPSTKQVADLIIDIEEKLSEIIKNSQQYDCKNPTAPTTDQFAGWKTYKNTKYGYEFQYPSNVGVLSDMTSKFLGPPTNPEEDILLIGDKEETFHFQVWDGKLNVILRSSLGDQVLSTFRFISTSTETVTWDSQNVGDFTGYYVKKEKDFGDELFGVSVCSALKVKSGDSALIKYYKDMVNRGNTINDIDDDGDLLLNINPGNLSEQDQNKIFNSNQDNQVTLTMKKKIEEGKGAAPCFSFLEIVDVK